MKTEVNKQQAQTIYIDHPDASYGIFCFNSVGDLFVNSDYGFYGFAWRSYGDSFSNFLSTLNASYMVDKFELNFRNSTGKKIPKYWKEKLTILVEAFIQVMKDQDKVKEFSDYCI